MLKNISQTLIPEFLRKNFGKELFENLDQNQHISVKGFAGSVPSILVAELFLTQKKDVLFIIDDKESSNYITSELEEMIGEENVLYFPETHLEPYQVEKTQNANIVLRTEVLNRLNFDKKKKIIVATASSLSEKVLKKEDFKAISHTIKVGDQLDFDFTEELLNQFNFNYTDFVSEPGEFSVRGGIVDVFSYAYEKPFRITFFGNEVESIKEFDIETQLSTAKVNDFELVSNMNFAVSGSKVSLLDLLPKDSFIVTKNAYLTVKKLKDFYEKAEQKFETLSKEIKHQKPEILFVSDDVFLRDLEKFKSIDFSSVILNEAKRNEESLKNKIDSSASLRSAQNDKIKTINLNQTAQPTFHKNFELLAEDLKEKKEEGYETWISFSGEKQKERLESIFEELNHDLPFKSFKSELHEGFVDYELKVSVYTDHQIFDRYQRYKAKNSFAKSEQLTLKDLMSLKVGDYITHIDHGIGKFMGLVKVTNDGKTQECFKLTYKNNDLLYVSIHSLHKISKYNGPDGREIVLNKLGSPTWKTLKQKTKAKVKQIAFDLIKLYAQRKTAKGFSFSPDSYLQNELEASFIYEDTPDQEKATQDEK
jgi:transcription-repair coupling factor (superfamily II helicase)